MNDENQTPSLSAPPAAALALRKEAGKDALKKALKDNLRRRKQAASRTRPTAP